MSSMSMYLPSPDLVKENIRTVSLRLGIVVVIETILQAIIHGFNLSLQLEYIDEMVAGTLYDNFGDIVIRIISLFFLHGLHFIVLIFFVVFLSQFGKALSGFSVFSFVDHNELNKLTAFFTPAIIFGSIGYALCILAEMFVFGGTSSFGISLRLVYSILLGVAFYKLDKIIKQMELQGLITKKSGSFLLYSKLVESLGLAIWLLFASQIDWYNPYLIYNYAIAFIASWTTIAVSSIIFVIGLSRFNTTVQLFDENETNALIIDSSQTTFPSAQNISPSTRQFEETICPHCGEKTDANKKLCMYCVQNIDP